MARRFANIPVIVLVGCLLTSSACSPQAEEVEKPERVNEVVHPGKNLALEDVDGLGRQNVCRETQYLYGDPNYWGPSRGFRCLLNSDAIVSLRVYNSPSATHELIDDWAEFLNSGNQIIYSDNWFATGPPKILDDLFAEYQHVGPTASAPSGQTMPATESNITLCSSIAYNAITDTVLQKGKQESDLELESYFKNYLGLEQLTKKVAQEVELNNPSLGGPLGDPQLDVQALVSRYDDLIKDLCKKNAQ
ncbi:MAG: hypothetical protein EOO77_23260 [Oxalobacteraceae bacterium]|nr:MAG: hypothetical protein EOO77_23260 [Oxalobacteraceae bacterium]